MAVVIGWKLAIMAVAGVSAMAYAALSFGEMVEPTELSSKSAWAALQSSEFQDRGRAQTGPLLRHVQGFAILGIPGVGEPLEGQTAPAASRRAWIILNEHSEDETLRLINAYPSYEIGCSYVETLTVQVPDLDFYVSSYLRTVCQ